MSFAQSRQQALQRFIAAAEGLLLDREAMAAGLAALRAAVEPEPLLFAAEDGQDRYRVGTLDNWTWFEPRPEVRDVAQVLWQLASQRGACRDVAHLAGAAAVAAGPARQRRNAARRLEHCTRRIEDAAPSLGRLLSTCLRTRVVDGRPIAHLVTGGRDIETRV